MDGRLEAAHDECVLPAHQRVFAALFDPELDRLMLRFEGLLRVCELLEQRGASEAELCEHRLALELHRDAAARKDTALLRPCDFQLRGFSRRAAGQVSRAGEVQRIDMPFKKKNISRE